MTTAIALKSRNLTSENISHGFFTREGGVSTGIYAGLNVGIGSDDDRESVLENRCRVAHTLGTSLENLVTVHQIHSPIAQIVNEPFELDDRPQIDGTVTTTPGLALGTLTADCGPVLFSDPENRVVGAAHAGWKGATGGILENTINVMEKAGAKREKIVATLGPTISRAAYEVGPEFVERLIKLNPNNTNYLAPSINDGHAMFDLPNYIVDRLTNAGIVADWTGHCTYGDEELFFSYRRKTHRSEPDYGRQIAAIMIKPE